MSLDLALLMAGSRERGELEARITSLLSDIQKSGEYFLDFHIGKMENNHSPYAHS